MSRLQKGVHKSQPMIDAEAWQAIAAWKWPLQPADLHKPCPRSNRRNRHFLVITGVAEWQMTSGAEVRSIAWRCPRCKDTFEVRQVKSDTFSGWTNPFVLHNGVYAGHVHGSMLGVDDGD